MFFRNENYARGGGTVLDIAVCSTVGENMKYVKEGNKKNEMKGGGEGASMMRWKRRDHCCQFASPKKNRRFYTICTTKRRPIECRLHRPKTAKKTALRNIARHTHEHTRAKTTTTRRDLFFLYTKKKRCHRFTSLVLFLFFLRSPSSKEPHKQNSKSSVCLVALL